MIQFYLLFFIHARIPNHKMFSVFFYFFLLLSHWIMFEVDDGVTISIYIYSNAQCLHCSCVKYVFFLGALTGNIFTFFIFLSNAVFSFCAVKNVVMPFYYHFKPMAKSACGNERWMQKKKTTTKGGKEFLQYTQKWTKGWVDPKSGPI